MYEIELCDGLPIEVVSGFLTWEEAENEADRRNVFGSRAKWYARRSPGWARMAQWDANLKRLREDENLKKIKKARGKRFVHRSF